MDERSRNLSLRAYHSDGQLRVDVWSSIADLTKQLADPTMQPDDRTAPARELGELLGLVAPIETYWAAPGPRRVGDTRRFRSSDDAVRHAGLDVTVYSSDGRRSAGHLARQGPPLLRWALYEAAVYAGQPSSPDHACFQRVKARLDGQLALLSMARKLARRCHHTLRNLDDQVLAAAA